MKIKFANKKEQSYIEAFESEEYFNGASRRTLTFEIDPTTVDIQSLSDLCTEANCQTLDLINEELEISNIYEGYVLKLKVGIESKLVNAESNTYADVVVLKLGKRTYIEQRLHDLGLD